MDDHPKFLSQRAQFIIDIRSDEPVWTPARQDLWRRVERHDFEPDTALNFTRRLARDHGWSLEDARAAVDAYRRFCFLAVVSPTPVTPSEIVDEVWHLHLIYSCDRFGRYRICGIDVLLLDQPVLPHLGQAGRDRGCGTRESNGPVRKLQLTHVRLGHERHFDNILLSCRDRVHLAQPVLRHEAIGEDADRQQYADRARDTQFVADAIELDHFAAPSDFFGFK